MNLLQNLILATALSTVLLAGPATANSVIHDESVNGDLSNNYQSPTQFSLALGVNSLIATSGWENDPIDVEYVRIDLPAGHQLGQLIMQSYSSVFGMAFIGVQSGPNFTFNHFEGFENINSLLGWAHFGPSLGHEPGDGLLPEIGAASPGIGFVPPLPGPTYTFWIQQTEENVTYQFDFVVTAVPEPTGFVLVLIAAAVVGGRRYRRRSGDAGIP